MVASGHITTCWPCETLSIFTAGKFSACPSIPCTKVSLSVGRSGLLFKTRFLALPPVHNQNGISIGSAVFAGFIHAWQTERNTHTDRPRYMCKIGRILCHALRCGLIITGCYSNGSDSPHRRGVTPLLRAIGDVGRTRRLDASIAYRGRRDECIRYRDGRQYTYEVMRPLPKYLRHLFAFSATTPARLNRSWARLRLAQETT